MCRLDEDGTRSVPTTMCAYCLGLLADWHRLGREARIVLRRIGRRRRSVVAARRGLNVNWGRLDVYGARRRRVINRRRVIGRRGNYHGAAIIPAIRVRPNVDRHANADADGTPASAVLHGMANSPKSATIKTRFKVMAATSFFSVPGVGHFSQLVTLFERERKTIYYIVTLQQQAWMDRVGSAKLGVGRAGFGVQAGRGRWGRWGRWEGGGRQT